MALANRRTTILLVGIAVVFTIVLIILCLTPSPRPHHYGQQGKSAGYTPKGIIIETEPPTTPESTTTTTTSTTSATSTTTATPTTTTETSTTEPEFPDVFGSRTTTEEYIYYNDSSTEDVELTTKVNVTIPVTTTTQEPRTTADLDRSDATTEPTAIEEHNRTTTAKESSTATPGETEEYPESTTESGVLSRKSTESDNDTTTEAEVLDEAGTTGSDLTNTTTEEAGYAETTTEEAGHAETTTEEVGHADTTAEETTEAETSVPETATVEETSPVEDTTLEDTTSATTTSESSTTTTQQTTTTLPTKLTTSIEEREKETECTHADCKEVAARMLDMMDHRASRCSDFYQYACGGVEDDPFLDPEDPNKDVIDRILRTLQSPVDDSIGVAEPGRQYFKSCIAKQAVPSKDDLSLLQAQVSKHGLLDPRVVGGDAEKYAFIDEDPFDLQRILADFIKYDFAPFFDVSLDVDKTDNTKFIVRLSIPLNGFDSGFSESIDTAYCRNLYDQTLADAVRQRKELDVNKEYEKLCKCRETGDGNGAMIYRLKEAATAFNLTGHIDETTLATEILHNTAIDAEYFLTDIKENWPPFSDLRYRLINKNYTEYRVADLTSSDLHIDPINWPKLLQAIVGRPVDKVQVYHEQELMGVLKRMAEEENAKLRNILLMLWTSRLYTDLVAPTTSSTTNTPEYCASVTQYLAPDIVSLIYLQSFPEQDLKLMKQKVDGVVNNVKRTVQAALRLTPGVSRLLQDKLHYTFTQVGAAEQLHLLVESVANSTGQLHLTGSYVSQSLELLQRRRKNMYRFLEEQADSDMAIATSRWNHFSVPYSLTATTLYSSNTILIPEGVMAPPLMYPSLAALPNYLLYAGIGHLVAHEFLHAIDTTGIKFDGRSADELGRPPLMNAQEHCLQQTLHTNFTLSVQKTTKVHMQLPVDLHINELMADTGATRLAWLAYVHGETAEAGNPTEYVTDSPSRRRRRNAPSTDSHELPLPWLNMTPYQLYLLKTAQTHCARTSNIDAIDVMEKEHLPARIRVNLAMLNEPLFAEAFSCPDDSMLNSKYTCPYVISHLPEEGPKS